MMTVGSEYDGDAPWGVSLRRKERRRQGRRAGTLCARDGDVRVDAGRGGSRAGCDVAEREVLSHDELLGREARLVRRDGCHDNGDGGRNDGMRDGRFMDVRPCDGPMGGTYARVAAIYVRSAVAYPPRRQGTRGARRAVCAYECRAPGSTGRDGRPTSVE